MVVSMDYSFGQTLLGTAGGDVFIEKNGKYSLVH